MDVKGLLQNKKVMTVGLIGGGALALVLILKSKSGSSGSTVPTFLPGAWDNSASQYAWNPFAPTSVSGTVNVEPTPGIWHSPLPRPRDPQPNPMPLPSPGPWGQICEGVTGEPGHDAIQPIWDCFPGPVPRDTALGNMGGANSDALAAHLSMRRAKDLLGAERQLKMTHSVGVW